MGGKKGASDGGEMTFEEIAKVLGVERQSVHRSYVRARDKIRSLNTPSAKIIADILDLDIEREKEYGL